MLLQRKQSVIQKPNRPEKGGNLSVAFPAPPAPFRAAHFVIHLIRRAVAGRTARLPIRFAKILWKLASRSFKISPNFCIEGQPFSKLRFCGRNFPRFFSGGKLLFAA